ncbi:MAG: NAD(P)H-hydrate dehydratase, partial [Verrucomicrobiota bacterium]
RLMKTVTTAQMRQLDARTVAAGTPSAVLMERAGRAVAQLAGEFLRQHNAREVLLLAGKGNNGGDAIVAARFLTAAGFAPTLITFDQLTGELPAAPLIIDGLLGTGLTGEVREPYRSAIEFINRSRSFVIAIDVPSGLGTGICVRADVTVTFGLPKIDLLQPAAADFVGRLEIADIGLLTTDVTSDVELLTRGDITLPERKRSAHKNAFGHLLIIAGAEGYTGAPVLCAHAAARSGVGLVTLAVPRNIYGIVAGNCPPEVMPVALDKMPALENFTAVAIGPGLGRLPETQAFVRDFVAKLALPVVVDADALDAVGLRPGLVLTPHPGEMGRLIGKTAQEIQANRWEIARQFACKQDVTLALKGAGTVVTDKSGKLWINSTGNPGMAKGGMGDALTGIIGALLAQGLPALEAVKAGVFLHGHAGDLAAQHVGEPALLATDLIAALSAAITALD